MTTSVLQNYAEQLREVTELLDAAYANEQKLFKNLEGAQDAVRHAQVELRQHQASMIAMTEKKEHLVDSMQELLSNARQ